HVFQQQPRQPRRDAARSEGSGCRRACAHQGTHRQEKEEMNVPAFQDWLFRSVVVGGAAAACVLLCPAGWRVRVRQVVPVVAFAVLIALGAGLIRPLPSLEMKAPAVMARWAAAAGDWIAPWLVWTF